ncbi:MAG: CotH kinase family protein [Flavobacteriales bacterium]
MKHLSLFFLLFAGFSATLTVRGQVVVNEFCFANYTDYTISGENEDWVEFFNPGGAAFDISGYWLSDNAANPQKWEIPAGTTVPANGYRMVLITGHGDYDPNYLGNLNTNFKLTQTAGEELVFSNTVGTPLETYDFDVITPNQANQSWGRSTNGGANWVIFTDPSPNASNSGPNGTAYAVRPTFSQEAGYYGAPISVTITTTEPGATIYYTLNGNDPTNASTLYTGPINLNATTVLKAVVYSGNSGILRSFISTNTYFFGADTHTIYTVSVSGDQIGNGAWNGDEACVIELFGPNGVFITEARGDSNEHGNDSNAYGQRGFDYITRDALGYDNEIEHPIFHHSDRDGYERIIFKAAANDNYPFSGGAHVRDAYVHELSVLGDLKMDERKTESCIVYLNGQYWGVYEMREKVDDIDYTDHYFDQPEGFVDFMKTWGGTWAEYGSGADWNALVNFVTTNDMTNDANYQYVLTQYNTHSLIDYFIMNTYIVSMDWLNWNTAWWRGRHPDGDARRWRYTLWDMDASFGHYVNYTGIPNTSPNSDPCQIEDMGNVGGQGHVPVLNALFDNEDFTADYINRYAMHSNTIFSCETMIAVLDSMIAVIEPEMTRQCQRWGGSVAGWQSAVQELRDFIEARCADEIIGGLEDCYDVTAYTVTIQIEGEGTMQIVQTEISAPDAPWSGTYFADLPIPIEALVEDAGQLCGTFQGWQIVSGTATIEDPLSDSTSMTIGSDVTLLAIFGSPAEGPVILSTDMNIAGAGTIEVNGTLNTTYPTETTFDPGSAVTLTATPNQWYEFIEWQANHSSLDPNETEPEVTMQSCVSDTVIAVFEWIPNYSLTVMVEPAGAGTITMDGTPLTLPYTEQLLGEENYAFVTAPTNVAYEFEYWTLNNHVLNPNEFSMNVSFTLSANDTLVAVYRTIPSYPLTVMVEPEGAGTVVMDGTLLTLPYTEVLLTEETHFFETDPTSIWSVFSHWEWESDAHVINPDEFAQDISFTFMEEETLVAVYTIIPHSTITVKVEPAFSGTVQFADGLVTESEISDEFEHDVPLTFFATPDAYWRFVGWKSSAGNIITPNDLSAIMGVSFNETDTITAYFEKEPFAYYLPNSFTPNNDGTNDVFGLVSNAIDPNDYRLMVFNRWGEKLFDSTDPDEVWDGSHQDGDFYVEDGVYIYHLRVKSIHEAEPKEITGSLTLFR